MTENERHLADEVQARAAGCPEAGRLEAYESGTLDAAARARIESHVASCGACDAALKFLATGSEGGGIPEIVVHRSEEWIGAARAERGEPVAKVGRWAWAAMVAAAAVFLLFVLPIGVWNEETGTPTMRDPAVETVGSLVPDRPLARSDGRLAWTPGPRGSSYRVTVFTEDLRQLLSRDGLDTAEFVVPMEVLASIEGDTIIWRVEVFPPDGARRQSGTFIVQLEE